MKNFKFFQVILLLLFLFSSELVFSQDDFIVDILSKRECEEPIKPVFPADMPSTLCENYGHGTFYLEIGEGTPYPTSLQLPSFSGLNLHAKGNFTIVTDYTFDNVSIKFDEGVAMIVDPERTLTISSSRLFACIGLWKGIMLNDQSLITMRGCTVEDAMSAIETSYPSTLRLNNNSFNRNVIGISVLNSSNTVFDRFIRNSFTCTSALNENSVDTEVTVNGMLFRESSFVPQGLSGESFANTFKGILYGIYADGESYIEAKNLVFEENIEAGLYMEKGYLNLTRSKFTNNYNDGIEIRRAFNLIINNISFTYDSDLPSTDYDASIVNRGIEIIATMTASEVSLNNITFDVHRDSDDFDKKDSVMAIEFNGAIRDDSTINIYNNIFNIFNWKSVARPEGIKLRNGTLSLTPSPSTSIHIFNNDFYSTSDLHGIYVSNDFSNVSIYENDFFGFYPSGAIILRNSEGQNNRVENNRAINYFGTIMSINECENTTYCSNISSSLTQSTGFWFSGDNFGTDFRSNKFYATGLGIGILDGGIIGEQEHKGNQWFPIGSITSIIHAECVDCNQFEALANRFIVHTPQSVIDNTTGTYSYFSEYHPDLIEPDGVSDIFLLKI